MTSVYRGKEDDDARISEPGGNILIRWTADYTADQNINWLNTKTVSGLCFLLL